jgi:peptide/nickel transport system substrate-binding protein
MGRGPIVLLNGPHRLVEWTPGESLTVEAVPNHWSGVTPEVQHATYLFRSEGSVRAGMVQNGEADIAAALPAQNAGDIPSTPVIQSETAYFELDSFSPPLDDLRVREAINLAIDRETIVETLFGGFATPATQLYPPGAFGTSPNIQPWPYDPERATELIAEAAADGVPTDTELLFVGRLGIYPNSSEVVTTVAEALRGIGLNIRVQMLEVSAWAEEIALDLGSRILQLQHGNATFDVGQGIPNVICPSGSLSKYEDADLQVLCDAVAVAPVDQREAALQAVIEYHHDVLKDPGVPLAHPQMIFGHSDAIAILPSYLGLVPLQTITFK